MTRTTLRPAVVSSLLGVTGIVLLAGCTSQATAEPAVDATTQATQGSGSDVAGSSSKYADGTYSADGSYSPKAGVVETVKVTLTLKNDVVEKVEVTGSPKEPESVEYQGKFIGGISKEVVGKKIDDLNVSRVAGSSLTSGGFNKAVDEIKAEAAA